MSEESVQALRDQLEAMQKDRLKLARRCATMFGTISIIALIAFVYGLVQHVDSARISEISRVNEMTALKAEVEARKHQDAFMKLRAQLDSCKSRKP
jgi:hypothetical protein